MGSGQILGNIIALGLLFTFCCPCKDPSQEIYIVKIPSTEAWLGQNLTIPCVLARDVDQELDLDLSTVGVRWSKILPNGHEMDVYKFTGHSHLEIRPGSAVEEKELKRGNASLTLHHVQRSDEGEYFCTIYVTPNKTWTKINVHLLAKPDITLSATELTTEPGREKSVICKVSKFYPEMVKIQWRKHEKSSGTWSLLNKKTYQTLPEENSDGSFNVSSQLVVEPSSPEENGDVYYCVVTHGSFSHDQKVSFTLIVKELPSNSCLEIKLNALFFGILVLVNFIAWLFHPDPPEVSEIVGLNDLVHMKRSTLTFMVFAFKPKNIEIKLRLSRTDSKEKIASWKYPPPEPVRQSEDHQRGEHLTLIHNEIASPLEREIQPLKPRGSFMSYSCLCSTYITPDKERDEGAELVIKVIHTGQISPLIVRQKIEISNAEPV